MSSPIPPLLGSGPVYRNSFIDVYQRGNKFSPHDPDLPGRPPPPHYALPPPRRGICIPPPNRHDVPGIDELPELEYRRPNSMASTASSEYSQPPVTGAGGGMPHTPFRDLFGEELFKMDHEGERPNSYTAVVQKLVNKPPAADPILPCKPSLKKAEKLGVFSSSPSSSANTQSGKTKKVQIVEPSSSSSEDDDGDQDGDSDDSDASSASKPPPPPPLNVTKRNTARVVGGITALPSPSTSTFPKPPRTPNSIPEYTLQKALPPPPMTTSATTIKDKLTRNGGGQQQQRPLRPPPAPPLEGIDRKWPTGLDLRDMFVPSSGSGHSNLPPPSPSPSPFPGPFPSSSNSASTSSVVVAELHSPSSFLPSLHHHHRQNPHHHTPHITSPAGHHKSMSADIITNPGSQWSSRGSMVLPNLDFTTPTPGTTISKSPRSSTASTASTSSSFSSSSAGNRWSNETSLTEPDLAPQDSGKAAKNGTTVGKGGTLLCGGMLVEVVGPGVLPDWGGWEWGMWICVNARCAERVRWLRWDEECGGCGPAAWF